MKIYKAMVSAMPSRMVSIEEGDILVVALGDTTRYFRGSKKVTECAGCPVRELKIKVGSSILPGCYALDFACYTPGFEEIQQEAIMEDLI